MKTALTFLIVAMAVCSCTRTPNELSERQTPEVAADIAQLKNGMLFSDFQSVLGSEGHIQPQPSDGEAHYIFDLEGKFVVTQVRTIPKPYVVTQFWVREDELTAEQRQAQRRKNISRAVVRPRLTQTNGVPNKTDGE